MENFDFELLPIYFQNFKKYLDKSINKDLKKYDINSIHFKPIILLYKYDGLSLIELTQKIGVDKANITRVINDLIQKDIVYKTDDKLRGYKIKLTKKGSEIANYIYENRKDTDKRIFIDFTEDEKKQFINLIYKYFKGMNNMMEGINEKDS